MTFWLSWFRAFEYDILPASRGRSKIFAPYVLESQHGGSVVGRFKIFINTICTAPWSTQDSDDGRWAAFGLFSLFD